VTAAALPGCEWALSVDPVASSLAEVRRFVERVALEVELGAEKTFDLKVAVSEACANAVEHAGCESRPLAVSARLHQRILVFVVRDDGLFRPPSYAREDCGNRGLGLPLMVTLMDEVNFAKTPDGGTVVTLSLMLGA
jgi:serine/threonine-protein kinase RsbW